MAVIMKNASRVSALALALSALTLPGLAQAEPEDGGRGHWRTAREDGGSRGDNRRSEGNRAGAHQRSQETAPQAAPQAYRQPRSSAPAPQAAPPPPPSRAAWGRDGGNAGNSEGRGNRENWQGRGNREGHGDVAATRTPPPATTRTTRWSGSGEDRPDRDGERRRDGSWQGRSGSPGTATTTRTWRDSDRWRDGDRDHDRDRWRDRDRNHWSGDRDGHRRWDRHWRDNHRYNWYTYRSHYPSYYRLGIYYAPYRHHHYRRLNIGFFLDSLFFSQRYWISDPWYYRLPDAYGPYRWVRYYDDALLVNIYTGEVVDVIYEFFW